jgi:hypothetical protein
MNRARQGRAVMIRAGVDGDRIIGIDEEPHGGAQHGHRANPARSNKSADTQVDDGGSRPGPRLLPTRSARRGHNQTAIIVTTENLLGIF